MRKYCICDPTGNITALVQGDGDVAVADKIMAANPAVEQVGFLTDGGRTLTMAGGEFCGNASMSAGAVYCTENGEASVYLRVSGADGPVLVTVDKIDGEGVGCTVKMPGKASVCEEKLTLLNGDMIEVPAVRLPGICHVILEDKMPKEEAEKTAEKWCGDLGECALGIMFFNEEKMTLAPLVYVPAAQTLFWESSCASGTAALGVYLAKKNGTAVEKEVSEPGGTLRVKAFPNGEVYLSGRVTVGAEKQIRI